MLGESLEFVLVNVCVCNSVMSAHAMRMVCKSGSSVGACALSCGRAVERCRASVCMYLASFSGGARGSPIRQRYSRTEHIEICARLSVATRIDRQKYEIIEWKSSLPKLP